MYVCYPTYVLWGPFWFVDALVLTRCFLLLCCYRPLLRVRSKRRWLWVCRRIGIGTCPEKVRETDDHVSLHRLPRPGVELAKFGPTARAHLFVQLHNFPTHYLVLVIADEDFRYALVSMKSVVVESTHTTAMVMDDIGWLDVARIRGGDIRLQPGGMVGYEEVGSKRKAMGGELMGRTSNVKSNTGRFVGFDALRCSLF